MQRSARQRLSNRNLWLRALFMVFFAVAYGISETIVTFVVIIQFLIILLTGRANERLLRLGNNLSSYIYQIVRFQTFNSETQPFPFSSWPDEKAEDNRWLEEQREEVPEPQEDESEPE